MYVCQLWYPVALLTFPGRRDPESAFLLKIYSLLIKGVIYWPFESYCQGGAINIWPVEPFETVPVIKGYTNKIELNWTSPMLVCPAPLSFSIRVSVSVAAWTPGVWLKILQGESWFHLSNSNSYPAPLLVKLEMNLSGSDELPRSFVALFSLSLEELAGRQCRSLLLQCLHCAIFLWNTSCVPVLLSILFYIFQLLFFGGDLKVWGFLPLPNVLRLCALGASLEMRPCNSHKWQNILPGTLCICVTKGK